MSNWWRWRIKENIRSHSSRTFAHVLEVIKAFEKNLKIAIPYQFVKKRDGDAETSYCSNNKAIKELNWKNKYSLNDAMINIKKIL